MATRRQRFRDAMARLQAAGSPSDAIERGFYIARPGGSAVSVISGRLELVPTASFLLIGGIGSGKTTELLMTAKTLNELDDTRAFYVDVSAIHDIKNMPAGTLTVVAGLELAKHISDFSADPDAEAARDELVKIARGYHIHHDDIDPNPNDDDFEMEDPDVFYVAGAIQRPETEARRLSAHVRERSQWVAKLSAPLRRSRPHLVLLFDSLDRKNDLKDFKDIIYEDIEALQRIGIGVVLTAPLGMMHGESRIMMQQYFQDRTYLQTAVDIQDDPRALEFLTNIIHARAPHEMIPEDACRALAKASGGVLRDMIALAHSALQEAYAHGGDRVEVKHVERVAKAFGRNLMTGVSEREHRSLSRVLYENRFLDSPFGDSFLLASQRIIVHSTADGEMKYSVHPTIEEFIEPPRPGPKVV
ncbi:MAG TPA: hypothetical protein PK156_48590 [Polyangium sp.]|nr:hypothetical protein [Polyangium sp.]